MGATAPADGSVVLGTTMIISSDPSPSAIRGERAWVPWQLPMGITRGTTPSVHGGGRSGVPRLALGSIVEITNINKTLRPVANRNRWRSGGGYHGVPMGLGFHIMAQCLVAILNRRRRAWVPRLCRWFLERSGSCTRRPWLHSLGEPGRAA